MTGYSLAIDRAICGESISWLGLRTDAAAVDGKGLRGPEVRPEISGWTRPPPSTRVFDGLECGWGSVGWQQESAGQGRRRRGRRDWIREREDLTGWN